MGLTRWIDNKDEQKKNRTKKTGKNIFVGRVEVEVSKIWFNDCYALPNQISFNFSPFKKEGVTLEITITDWAEIHQVVSTVVSGIFGSFSYSQVY